MTYRLKEQFKGSVSPGAGSLKDKQNQQDFNQTHQGKKREDLNKEK